MAGAESNCTAVGTSGALTEAEQNRVILKVAPRLVQVLVLAYFFNSLDKSNIGLAALQMNHALGLTNATFGLASDLLFIGLRGLRNPRPTPLRAVSADSRRWVVRVAHRTQVRHRARRDQDREEGDLRSALRRPGRSCSV